AARPAAGRGHSAPAYAAGSEVATREARLKGQGSIFSTAGGFAPTLGIIGTVIGLVHVLGNLSEPDKLGPAIAVAFIATLYGIAFANLLFLPLGKKMTFVAKQDAEMSIAIVEGVLSIQAGENPRVVQEKIRSFMKEEEWQEIAAKLEAK
ncbi:MAG: MotA/TolQ/ExbB proton channel family protein, partial [Candidatus Hydrogenedentota bacterium]